MEKADGGEVGLDGAGRFIILLHPENIGGQMLAADIGQLLETIFVGQICAEPLHGLIVPVLGAEAALTVMPCQFVQLADKSQKDTLVLNFHCHI